MVYLRSKRLAIIEKKLERNPKLNNNWLIDQNSINAMFYISSGLKVFTLFMMIISFSFFMAMFFKAVLEVEIDFFGDTPEYILSDCSSDGALGYFSNCYGLDNMDPPRSATGNMGPATYEMDIMEDFIKINYYFFTTLTTVGFGDFHPKSNIERFVVAF